MYDNIITPYLFVIVIDYIMRKALTGREDKLGFQLRKRQSRRVPPIIVTDMDYAYVVRHSLVSDGIKEAEEILRRVKLLAKCIGLSMNTGKTKYMSYNNNQQFDIMTIYVTYLKIVEDFKYIKAWIEAKKMSKSEKRKLENLLPDEKYLEFNSQ